MKRIFEAKNEYNAIPIPPELSDVVLAAIEKGEKNRRKGNFYIKRFSYAAACAVLLIAVGVSGALNREAPVNGVVEAEVSAPGAGAAKTRALVENACFDTAYSTMTSEREKAEKEKGNSVTLIYFDEKFASFEIFDVKTSEKRYMNIFCDDGRDASLRDLGVSGYREETKFYISSRDTVVIVDGEAYKEVKIKR